MMRGHAGALGSVSAPEVGGTPSRSGVHKRTFRDASRRVCRRVTFLHYTEDGHSSEHVLVVNPLTGEQKIVGVPTLDNGASA